MAILMIENCFLFVSCTDLYDLEKKYYPWELNCIKLNLVKQIKTKKFYLNTFL